MEMERLLNLFIEHSLVFKWNTKSTAQTFKYDVNRYLNEARVTCLSDIHRMSIKTYILDMQAKRGWSAKTIRNILQSLSIFCDWLVKEDYLPTNPVKTIDRPKVKKSLRSFLSKEKAEELLEWTRTIKYQYRYERSRAYAVIATFIFTGIRKRELLSLKMNDVKMDQETLYVREGKGQKERMVPICPRLIDVLQSYLKDRERLWKKTDAFFTALRHDQAMSEKALARLVKRLKESSRIEFFPHLLRHTFATLMLQGGCPIQDLSAMLWHSDIQSTIPYLHSATQELHKTIRKHPMA